MHYRQLILDAVEAAIEALPPFAGHVTSANIFPADIDRGFPWVRVYTEREVRDAETEVQNSQQQPRILNVSLRLILVGENVQRDGNAALELIEGALPAALADFSDCSYLEVVEWSAEADQDRETYNAVLDYSVYYVTALGDPATRV